jgi:tellurite resistance protein TerC
MEVCLLDVPLWVWIASAVGVLLILVFDFYSHVKTPHEPTLKEAGIWSTVYVVGALIFGVGVWYVWDAQHGLEYFTGYLTEKALSVDNLFVFLIIMTSFAVPRIYQQKVLLWGVAIALVFRTVFILLGAALINNFSWIFYIFGIFLLYTGWTLAKADPNADEEYEENAFIRFVRRLVPVTTHYVEDRMSVRIDKRFMLTPMALVMIAIGSTDLLFALDSIPAIYGITSEPYLVFMTNAWALLGLRQLYFLLGGLLNRLVFLSYGLAFILAWIGFKLIVHAMHENEVPFINGGEHITIIPEVPTWLSLSVIAVTIAVATIFSLRHTARQKANGEGEHVVDPEKQGAPRETV